MPASVVRTIQRPRIGESNLILTRDLPFDERDLPLDVSKPTEAVAAEQLSLPGVDAPPRTESRRPGSPPRQAPPVADPLLATYLRRLAAQGGARKGWQAYRYHLRSTLTIASRL